MIPAAGAPGTAGSGYRYAQCDDTCTTDCGACKGAGRPAPAAPVTTEKRLAKALWPLLSREVRDIASVPARVALPGVDPDALAAALLPVVRELQAEELEAAAAAYESDGEQPYINHLADTVYRPGDCLSSIWLRARAAALRGER